MNHSPLIGAFIRRLYDALDDQVQLDLAAHGFGEIRVAHHPVFRCLSFGSRRVTDLAACARMTKQSMQALVDDLEEGGYLVREPDPSDGRAKLVRLTGRGEEVVRLARATIEALEREWSAVVGVDLHPLLRRLAEHLDAEPG